MRSARCRPRCRGVSIRCACVRRASVSMPRVSDGGSSSRGCCADAGCRGRSHPSASGSDGSMPQAAAMRRRGGRRVVWRLRRIISSPSWRGSAAPSGVDAGIHARGRTRASSESEYDVVTCSGGCRGHCGGEPAGAASGCRVQDEDTVTTQFIYVRRLRSRGLRGICRLCSPSRRLLFYLSGRVWNPCRRSRLLRRTML